jgi:hypothetical protein
LAPRFSSNAKAAALNLEEAQVPWTPGRQLWASKEIQQNVFIHWSLQFGHPIFSTWRIMDGTNVETLGVSPMVNSHSGIAQHGNFGLIFDLSVGGKCRHWALT